MPVPVAEPNTRHASNPPAGAHRPHARPFDLRYDDEIGLCNGGGRFTLPGTEQPAGWTLQGCPPGPRKPGAAGRPALPSPREAALSVWWQTTLPDPTMATSPPDGAITGLALFLQLGGPQTLTFDVPSLGHNVNLEVRSTYDIDWGDPSPDRSALGAAVTRSHPTQGGLYPNGDLRHEYIERGNATITVTQRWTAHWTAGGESGTISDVLYTQASRTIPVQEIQAILTSP